MAVSTVLDVKTGDQAIFPAVFGGNAALVTAAPVPAMYLGIRKVYEIHPDVARYIRRVEAIDGQPLESSMRQAVGTFVDDMIEAGFYDQCGVIIFSFLARTVLGANVPLRNPYFSFGDQGLGGFYYSGFHDILPQYYDRKRGMLFPAGSKAGYTFRPNAPPNIGNVNVSSDLYVYGNQFPLSGAQTTGMGAVFPPINRDDRQLFLFLYVTNFLGDPQRTGRGYLDTDATNNNLFFADPQGNTCKSIHTKSFGQNGRLLYLDGLPVGTAVYQDVTGFQFPRTNVNSMDYGAGSYHHRTGPQPGSTNDSRMQIAMTTHNIGADPATYLRFHNIVDSFVTKVLALP